MKEKILKLNFMELGLVENALNAHWNDAVKQLDNGYKVYDDNQKFPLGTFEKKILKERKNAINSLLIKIGSIYFFLGC